MDVSGFKTHIKKQGLSELFSADLTQFSTLPSSIRGNGISTYNFSFKLQDFD